MWKHDSLILHSSSKALISTCQYVGQFYCIISIYWYLLMDWIKGFWVWVWWCFENSWASRKSVQELTASTSKTQNIITVICKKNFWKKNFLKKNVWKKICLKKNILEKKNLETKFLEKKFLEKNILEKKFLENYWRTF